MYIEWNTWLCRGRWRGIGEFAGVTWRRTEGHRKMSENACNWCINLGVECMRYVEISILLRSPV